MITKKVKDETYVLIWVNKNDFYSSGIAVDSTDWFYSSGKEILSFFRVPTTKN
jgi:hypothetical protein